MKKQYWSSRGLKWGLIFIASFVAGVFVMNAKQEALLYENGFLGEYTLMCMKYAEPENREYLWYLLQRRAGGYILLAFLSTTYLGIAGIATYIVWYGFSLGMFLAGAGLRYGGKGILLFFGSMFPQCVLYMPVGIFFLCWCYNICRTLYYPSRGVEIFCGSRKQFIFRKILQFQIILIVVIIICLLERYINPYIITKILKNI